MAYLLLIIGVCLLLFNHIKLIKSQHNNNGWCQIYCLILLMVMEILKTRILQSVGCVRSGLWQGINISHLLSPLPPN